MCVGGDIVGVQVTKFSGDNALFATAEVAV